MRTKEALLRTAFTHIAKLWVTQGHERWPWLMPELERVEEEFAALSFEELRERLRGLYRRLLREIDS